MQWYFNAIPFLIGIATSLLIYYIARRSKVHGFFLRLISSEYAESSKRFITLFLVAVYVISHFLLMYFKIEIANQKLVGETLDGIKLMALVFGGLVVGDKVIAAYKARAEASGQAEVTRAEKGTPENVVRQSVQNQNIDVQGNISTGITTTTTTLQQTFAG